MAETSKSYNSNKESNTNTETSSNIVNLGIDHIFIILLSLPVDSILSFSMTCKRFWSLTSSDALWKSVCRREWGHRAVDALEASYGSQQYLSWKKLFKQVYELDCVICHKLSDPDGDLILPYPRASHSLNFVSDCLVLFGGGCDGGRHLDDTWVAYIGNGFQKMLKWQKVNSGIPSGRFGHVCVVVGNYLVLFGGINDHGMRQNDTWVGQVLFSSDLGITISWKLLDVGSIAPPPRGAHAACCIDNNKMVIHGGIGLNGVRLGDTWVLEFSENFCLGSWHEVVSHHSPPARSGHSLTCIGVAGTVLFGGRGMGYEVLNDVWLLYMSEGQLKWVQMVYDLQTIPEGGSLPRVGHSATLILSGRVLIYGGEDSYRHRKGDFWVLDTRAIRSDKLHPTSLTVKGLQANMWKRLKSKGYKPNYRSFHRACVDNSGRYLFVFGGMVDGALQPSEASGLRFDGELFLVELVSPL